MGSGGPVDPGDFDAVTVHREMRWFINGPAPDELVPQERGRRRTDAYHVPTLSAHAGLKWRGGQRRLEWKQRVGRVELATWGGVQGYVECWVKQRTAWPRRPTAWLDVEKVVWDVEGIEICRAVVGPDVVWTCCVDVDRVAEPTTRALGGWREVLADAEANSFAGFLSARLGEADARSIAS